MSRDSIKNQSDLIEEDNPAFAMRQERPSASLVDPFDNQAKHSKNQSIASGSMLKELNSSSQINPREALPSN